MSINRPDPPPYRSSSSVRSNASTSTVTGSIIGPAPESPYRVTPPTQLNLDPSVNLYRQNSHQIITPGTAKSHGHRSGSKHGGSIKSPRSPTSPYMPPTPMTYTSQTSRTSRVSIRSRILEPTPVFEQVTATQPRRIFFYIAISLAFLLFPAVFLTIGIIYGHNNVFYIVMFCLIVGVFLAFIAAYYAIKR